MLLIVYRLTNQRVAVLQVMREIEARPIFSLLFVANMVLTVSQLPFDVWIGESGNESHHAAYVHRTKSLQRSCASKDESGTKLVQS